MLKLPCLLRLCCSLDVYSSNVLALFVVLICLQQRSVCAAKFLFVLSIVVTFHDIDVGFLSRFAMNGLPIRVNDGALYTSVGVPTVCICNGAASITGHYFNGCPSPWKGIVGNGANVARVFLDHQGLSTDVDLSVSLNLTTLVKPHREKASSRIVDRRQYPMYYKHFNYLSEILNKGFTSNDKVLLVHIPGPDFIDAYLGCLKAKLLSIRFFLWIYLRDGIDNLLVLLIGGIPIVVLAALSASMAIDSHMLS
ncbi:hypothetical protein AAG906_038998 [Vitis piasezkii]